MLNRHATSIRQEATNIRKYLLAHQAYIALIAVYTILGTAWAAFAHFVRPNIIAPTYADRSPSMLNRWSLFTGAIDIAVVLHFVIVFVILSIDRKHKLHFRDEAKTNADTNIV